VKIIEKPWKSSDNNGYIYDWINNDILFNVEIMGYDNDECMKIIETMIR
jgi:hypothetical protein